MSSKPLFKGLKVIGNYMFKNSEVICSLTQATAMTIALVETFKAAPEIMKDLEDMRADLEICKDEEARKDVTWKTVQKVAKKLTKPAMAAAVAYGMQVLSPILSGKKQAALAVAYGMSEKMATALDENLDAIAGKKKADQIREKAANDIVKDFSYKGSAIVNTGHGDQLFFMMSTGVWFRSSPDYVRLCVSRINENLNDYEEQDLNDLLDDMGLERCELGNLVGWSARDGERAEVDLRNTGMYVDNVTGLEEAAIFVNTNETPLRNVYGDLDWHHRY